MPKQLTKSEAIKIVKKWDCLGMFPRTGEGTEALAEAFMCIVGDEPMALWLSNRVIHGCSRCPTPIELRRIFARKFPPADGLSDNYYDNTEFMAVAKRGGE